MIIFYYYIIYIYIFFPQNYGYRLFLADLLNILFVISYLASFNVKEYPFSSLLSRRRSGAGAVLFGHWFPPHVCPLPTLVDG